ncbi:MAG: DMT family transporter, partial [Candidatus Thermoplasmatota archaeon]|nr:DMT family transporter [Candidatus Thermoplasmatota archaeon]
MRQHKSKKLNDLHLIFLMVAAVIFWAFAFPFIKIGLDELSFVNLTILRFLIVDVVFLFVILIKPRSFSKLYKKDVIPIFILGFFGVMVYHLGLNYGEQFVLPGAASLIIATTPIFILISAVIFLKEKIDLRKFIGVLFALLGLIIITVWGTENASIQIDYVFGA